MIRKEKNSLEHREYNIPNRVLRDLSKYAEKYGIQQIILFGSRATGQHTDRSDIDIAVTGGDFDGFYWDVKEKIHSLLTFDIVNLNDETTEKLIEELEKDGVRIYEKA